MGDELGARGDGAGAGWEGEGSSLNRFAKAAAACAVMQRPSTWLLMPLVRDEVLVNKSSWRCRTSRCFTATDLATLQSWIASNRRLPDMINNVAEKPGLVSKLPSSHNDGN